MTPRNRTHFLVLAIAAASGTWQPAAVAADDPPTLRVRLVGDIDATSLDILRKDVQQRVGFCRDMQHLPKAPPPPLPDSQLSRIVFYENVTLYRPDRIAQFSTSRFVVVDESSNCEPYVWVQRSDGLKLGCTTSITGNGPMAPITYMPGMPPPAGPQVRSRTVDDGCRPPTAWDLRGLPKIDAGGASCVWFSALMWDKMTPQMRAMAPQMDPGTGGKAPAAKGDTCVHAGRPSYESRSVQPDFVVLKTFHPHKHSTFNLSSDRDIGIVLYNNAHLAEFREGVPIPDAEVSEAAIQGFVQKPYRESMPAER